MDDTIWNVYQAIREYQYNLCDANTIIQKANILYKLLSSADHAQLETFIEKHYDELVKIKFVMTNIKNNSGIRSIHDKLFIKTLAFGKHTPLGITRRFETFLKGITYFSKDFVEIGKDIPIYHRLASCGPYVKTANFKCASDMQKNEIRKTKKRIETCYLERLVYDRLYRDQTLFFPEKGNKDKAHEDWLKQTKDEFKTCFPNTNIEVLLEYDTQGKYPTKLIVTRYKNDKIANIQEYEKVLVYNDGWEYDIDVKCTLRKNNITKMKFQSFNKESKWKVPLSN
jgi:hypothetical protein